MNTEEIKEMLRLHNLWLRAEATTLEIVDIEGDDQ